MFATVVSHHGLKQAGLHGSTARSPPLRFFVEYIFLRDVYKSPPSPCAPRPLIAMLPAAYQPCLAPVARLRRVVSCVCLCVLDAPRAAESCCRTSGASRATAQGARKTPSPSAPPRETGESPSCSRRSRLWWRTHRAVGKAGRAFLLTHGLF